MSRTIAVIPARAGSKRVPRKNVRLVDGQPLIVWSIKAALADDGIDDVIVSTDDPDAADVAQRLSATVYERPAALASDTSSTLAVLQQVSARYHEESGFAPELIVLLQPTSPLRDRNLIKNGRILIQSDQCATSLISVFPVRHFTGALVDGYWQGDFPETTRSQDLPVRYVPSGSLYIYRYHQTIALGTAWGSRVLPLIEDPAMVVNIDEEADFERFRQVLAAFPGRYQYLLE